MKLVSPLLIAGLVAINTALGLTAWDLSSSPLPELGFSPTGQNPNFDIDLASIRNDLKMIDAAAYEQLAARPPFSSSRRPKAKAPPPPKVQRAPEPVVVIQPLRAELIGVVIDNERKKALIRVPSGQQLQILEHGDQIGDWQLELIEDARVVFKRDTEQTELLLRPAP